MTKIIEFIKKALKFGLINIVSVGAIIIAITFLVSIPNATEEEPASLYIFGSIIFILYGVGHYFLQKRIVKAIVEKRYRSRYFENSQIKVDRYVIGKGERFPDLTPLHTSGNFDKDEEPTEKQLRYAKEAYGIDVIGKISFRELSNIISRFEDSDYNRPSEALAKYGVNTDAEITPYMGEHAIFGWITHQLDVPEKIAFFAYCMHCLKSNKQVGDMRDSIHYDDFVSFGEEMAEDAKFVKSITDRPASDFYDPNKNTRIYKETRDFLETI